MVATKQALEKNQAKTIVLSFFKLFDDCCNKPTPPVPADFEKILSRNFNMASNGKTVARNLDDYCKRLQNMQKQWKKYEVSSLLEEPLVCGNKFCVYYKATFTTQKGEKQNFQFMATGTIEDNKCTYWNQVVHQEGTGQLDA